MKPIAPIASAFALVGLCVFGLAAFAKTPSPPTPESPKPSSPSPLVERGRYLVNRTGLCIDCHSPRDTSGNHIEGKHLTGAPIGVAPLAPMPWSTFAPRLAGLPAGFSRTEMIHFLMTGERPHGRPGPLPPMPPYRFDEADAEAVTAYLESLPVPKE
jgi:mono/diheme cytochrome c family protein